MDIRIRAVCNKLLKISHQTKSVRFPLIIFVHFTFNLLIHFATKEKKNDSDDIDNFHFDTVRNTF